MTTTPPHPPPPLRIAIAGAGISGSILASQLAKHPNATVCLIERFARGALPPGLNLLLNHNGMAALRALDPHLAGRIGGVGEPMVSWSAHTATGEMLYDLGDVVEAGLADAYGVRGRWRDLTATCQLAAVASDAVVLWRTEISDVRYNRDDDGGDDVDDDDDGGGGGTGGRAPLTLTLRRAAEVDGGGTGPDSYSNQEEAGGGGEEAPSSSSSSEARRAAAEDEAWRNAAVETLDVDLLIGCDGRYSAVRKIAALYAPDDDDDGGPDEVYYGPPNVSDFRLVVPMGEDDAERHFSGRDASDLRRVYNVPCLDEVERIVPGEELASPENRPFLDHCVRGLARVGIMTISPSRLDAWGSSTTPLVEDEGMLHVGFFGNFRLPPDGEPIPSLAKTAIGLRAMYTPAGGEGALDPLGLFVLRTLVENADKVHWTRMQSTSQRVLPGVVFDRHPPAADGSGGDDDDPEGGGGEGGAPVAAVAPLGFSASASAHFGGRVLLLGDAAGAMYPALGQGANQAIEDACVAAHVLGAAFSRAREVEGEGEGEGAGKAYSPGTVDVASAVDAIWDLRQPRREFVSCLSREHSAHIARRDGRASLRAEAADWTGADGGRYDDAAGGAGAWRWGLRRLWSGWQRPRECVEAFERACQRNDAARRRRVVDAAAVGDTAKFARTATRENFAPFGDLVGIAPDGENWSVEKDADLVGFDGRHGFPRFYLMALGGPRPYRYDRVTHHARVTQCLGAASATEDFYLAVHAPTIGADGVAWPPDPAGVRVFRVAPHTFVKLHRGTWHAGPLWGEAPERVFYNLELHDTNEVDHNTVVFDDAYTFEPCT